MRDDILTYKTQMLQIMLIMTAVYFPMLVPDPRYCAHWLIIMTYLTATVISKTCVIINVISFICAIINTTS